METTEKKLAFGLREAVPAEAKAAWGARLIEPGDLLHDRQDLVSDSDEDKAALVAWLNGTPAGTGALKQMQEFLLIRDYPNGDRFTAFEDERGIIAANTNRSFGYVYVAGWLK